MIELVKIAAVALLKNLLVSALSEQALKIVVIGGLRKLSQSTKNTIDDNFVDEIERGLNREPLTKK